MFLTPTPFNTQLWRVVVLTDEGYLEGFDSSLLDEGQIHFEAYESDQQALAAASDVWAVARLRWFSNDFVKSHVDDGKLIVSDLRMGQEPTDVFTYAAAAGGNSNWHAIPTERIPVSFSDRVLPETWRRLWSD